MLVYWKCDECNECNPYPGRGVCESCGARMTPAGERAALLRQEEEKRRLEEEKRQRLEAERRRLEEEKRKADAERLPKETPEPSRAAAEKETPGAGPVWKSAWDRGFPKLFRQLCNRCLMLLLLAWVFLVQINVRVGLFQYVDLNRIFNYWVCETEILPVLAYCLNFSAVMLLLHIYIASPSKQKPQLPAGQLDLLSDEACMFMQCYHTGFWLLIFGSVFRLCSTSDNFINIIVHKVPFIDYPFYIGWSCLGWLVMYLLGLAVRAGKVPNAQSASLGKEKYRFWETAGISDVSPHRVGAFWSTCRLTNARIRVILTEN